MSTNTNLTKPGTTAAVRTTDPAASLSAILNSALPELKRMAPRYINPSRLVALAIEAKMRNPLLANCSPVSVLNFCKVCAERGTDRIGAGGMWAVPFWNSKTNTFDMTPIPDWRFIVETAKKAKAIKHAVAEAVFEGDTFEYERGLEPRLVHKPAIGKAAKGKITAVYCVYVLPDDTKDFCVMDWDEIVAIRDRTNAWKSWIEKKRSNPWVTDEGEQGKKTVVKRALKIFQGASPELTALLDLDNATLGFGDMMPVQEPIQPPVVTPNAAPTIDAHAEDVTPSATPEPPADDNGQTSDRAPLPQIEGLVEFVSAPKEGKKSFGIKVGGVFYNTLHRTLAEQAKTAMEEKKAVRIQYAERPYGEGKVSHDILTLVVLGNAPEQPKPSAKDEDFFQDEGQK